MQRILKNFDELAGIETENIPTRRLERAAFAFLILMILAAPHSIAATQTAWLTGMSFWLIRLFIKPRPKLFRTALDIPLWAFFVWSIVSSIFSYAADISLDKLRGAAVFLIFYFVINNLKNARAVRFLAFALIFSCMINVLWTPIQRIIGRGVEIHGVSAQSPLAKAFLIEGDALLEADGKKLKAPEDLLKQIEQNEITKVKFYRPDFEYTVEVKRENLLGGANALERLGIGSWKKSRNWRSAGFYGHFATYAEVLQLIASLAFGLLIASFLGRNFLTQRRKDAVEIKDKRQKAKGESETEEQRRDLETENEDQRPTTKNRISPFLLFSSSPLLLFFCVAAMSLALLLTVTRASQLGFLVSALAIVIACGNRKLVLSLAALILPIAIGGLLFLQQSRNVKFFDAKDDSTLYRVTMYRDGLRLWTENPRHFFVGVGMDSIQRYWREWRLFDGGKLPMGHFHSTPVQLLVERGLPAFLIWLWLLWTYARTLARALKLRITNYELRITNSEEQSKIQNLKSKIEIGIILGSFGGLIGFFTSGLVHYNLGDQEVAMVFFVLMGLSVFLARQNEKLKIQNNPAVGN